MPTSAHNTSAYPLILWAAPLTLFGLLVAALLYALSGFRGQWRVKSPAISLITPLSTQLFSHPKLNLSALCIGQLIIARDEGNLQSSWAHECVHIRQAQRYGPLFPFLYCGHSLWCALTGRHAYWNNVFEVEARAGERESEEVD
jgi:hypothetical protein